MSCSCPEGVHEAMRMARAIGEELYEAAISVLVDNTPEEAQPHTGVQLPNIVLAAAVAHHMEAVHKHLPDSYDDVLKNLYKHIEVALQARKDARERGQRQHPAHHVGFRNN